ncbi:hypothetical protein ACA910_022708 [Epithemia clementina (nom. ined.)]
MKNGILVAELTYGDKVLAQSPDYEAESRQTIANLPGTLSLTGNGQGDVYASNFFAGTIVQIYSNGRRLDSIPIPIASVLAGPEGIAFVDHNNEH